MSQRGFREYDVSEDATEQAARLGLPKPCIRTQPMSVLSLDRWVAR